MRGTGTRESPKSIESDGTGTRETPKSIESDGTGTRETRTVIQSDAYQTQSLSDRDILPLHHRAIIGIII